VVLRASWRHLGRSDLASKYFMHYLSCVLHLTSISYGERGFIHIYKTLRQLFPTISPPGGLEVDLFLRHVLLPETARLLIQKDFNISSSEALDVLLASQDYGAARFPDKGEDEEKV
jgi:hypothetical protein